MEKLDKETINAIAKDVFSQAAEGYAVEVDPDVADELGIMEEDTVTLADAILSDAMEDALKEAENGKS